MAIRDMLLSSKGDGVLYAVNAVGLAANDETEPLRIQGGAGIIAAVQFVGNFGTGTVRLRGSIDGVTYYDLEDTGGATIAATAVGLYEFATACRFVKAVAGANVTEVFVHLVTQK